MGIFTDELVAQGLMIDHVVENVEFRLSQTSRSMASISLTNVETFGYEMDNVIRALHPAVKDMIVRNAKPLLDTLRVLNVETKAGFRGATGSGNTIDFAISRAATTYRRSWKRYLSDVSINSAFITGTGGSSADWSLTEEQAALLMGFVNRADIEPKSSAIKITYNSDPMNYQALNFGLREVMEQNIVVHELKESAMIAPEQSIKVEARYDGVGYDYLQPIIVLFERSIDLRTM
jgi:hypothetical protein